MYIGDTSVIGILHILRELLDSAMNPSATEIVLHDGTLSIQIAATSPSIALRPQSNMPFLLEACSKFTIAADEPPTLALCEVLDENVNPAVFRQVPQIGPALAIANALSSEFRAASICAGIATTFFFSRGQLIRGPESSPTPAPDGLALFFAPDPEIFGDAVLGFHQVASVARDVACVNQRRITVLMPSRNLKYVSTSIVEQSQ